MLRHLLDDVGVQRLRCHVIETGHFPQLEEPVRFARVLIDFIENTDPAEFEFSDRDLDMLRERVLKCARRSR